jgi:alkaline phosphatase
MIASNIENNFLQTYNADRSTPDSAGTGTAYLCGVKANMETIGVSDKVKFGDCSAVTADTKVRSILKESIAAGENATNIRLPVSARKTGW